MATFTAGTSFTDGVTGDVTAAKLNALVANATPLSNFITDRTAETSIATDDLVLISDTSDSGALNKMTVANLMKAEITGTINSTAGTITTATIPTLTAGTTTGTAATFTSGTITTLNSTTGTITTGVIPTLTSTTLITSGTGTAASPAIVPTGDTNTGIFFPAADTIAFSEGGTESMRIDSSGNVGIGTSSPARKLTISASGEAFTSASNPCILLSETSSGRFGLIEFDSSTNLNIWGSDAGSGSIRFFNGTGSGTERLRIDSSGNVGIGTTSPSDILHVSKANGVSIFESTGVSSVGIRLRTNSTDRWQIGCPSASADLAIYTGAAATERLRIDSNGNVGIGITDPSNYNANANNLVVGDTTSANGITITSGTASSGGLFFADEKVTGFSGYLQYDHSSDYIRIGTNATERLRITSGGEVYIAGTTDQGAYNLQVNGTGVWGAGAYVNGSDERLKENIKDITSGLDVVEKLRPVSFQYKEDYTADRSVQSGFIAQDLLVALEGKNYLDGIVSQGPTYYNVAYQNLIPILAKAIQELKAENDNLKARIEALEAA